jgi:hypothetical protein
VITDATTRGVDETVQAIASATAAIFDDCFLPNGGLIAAPCQLPIYPIDAPQRFVCHPGRDIPLAIAAMNILGRDVSAQLAPWVFDRALRTGFLVHAYAPNGLPTTNGPDRDGARLIAAAIGPLHHENRVLLAEGVATRPADSNDDLIDRIVDATPASVMLGDSTPLWAVIARIVRLGRDGDHAATRERIHEVAALADRAAHLPEWAPVAGAPAPPRPSLASHCAFVIAAHAAGMLAPR